MHSRYRQTTDRQTDTTAYNKSGTCAMLFCIAAMYKQSPVLLLFTVFLYLTAPIENTSFEFRGQTFHTIMLLFWHFGHPWIRPCLKWPTQPLEKRRLRPISAHNVSTVRASKNVQLSRIGSRSRAFQRAIDKVRTPNHATRFFLCVKTSLGKAVVEPFL